METTCWIIQRCTASVLEDADYNPVLDYDSYLANFGPKTFTADGNKFKFRKRNQKELVEAKGPLTKSFALLVSKNCLKKYAEYE